MAVIHRSDSDIGHLADVEVLLRLVGNVSDVAVDSLIVAVSGPFHVLYVLLDSLDISEVINSKIEGSSDSGIEEGAHSAKDSELLVLLLGICRCMEEGCLELLTVVFDAQVCSVLLFQVCFSLHFDCKTLDDFSLDDILHGLADDMVDAVT